MSLRRRLLATMALVLVVGLVVVDVVTYTALRSALLGRLDEQLVVAQHQIYRYTSYVEHTGHPLTSEGLDNRVSPDVYAVIFDHHGRVLAVSPSGSQKDPDPMPDFPPGERVLPLPEQETFGRHQGPFRPSGNSVTVGARSDPAARYRATALAVPQGVAFTAVSLNSTVATLDSIARIEVLVTTVVVVLLCVVALWTVRRGLRPLEDMAATAGAIAGGDLTRRVPTVREESEVGRLGSALNTMLTTIEESFNEKVATEARLRQFVADASHELRTPLTSIQGYTELLRKGAFADEEGRRRALQRVENEAVRMSAMVDDLLLLARLDEGRSLDHIPVDLARVAAEAVEDARAVEGLRPIELSAEGRAVVLGDRYALHLVAHNLVRNALAHTPPGAPVRVVATTEGGQGVLRVSDRGPGLDVEAQARVFDRFYRADSARTGAGTGLGLAIVRALAEAMGGSATVTSSPGHGATFTVAVPLAPRGVAPPHRSSAPRAPAPASETRSAAPAPLPVPPGRP